MCDGVRTESPKPRYGVPPKPPCQAPSRQHVRGPTARATSMILVNGTHRKMLPHGDPGAVVGTGNTRSNANCSASPEGAVTAGIFTRASTQSTFTVSRFHMTVAASYLLHGWYGTRRRKDLRDHVGHGCPMPNPGSRTHREHPARQHSGGSSGWMRRRGCRRRELRQRHGTGPSSLDVRRRSVLVVTTTPRAASNRPSANCDPVATGSRTRATGGTRGQLTVPSRGRPASAAAFSGE